MQFALNVLGYVLIGVVFFLDPHLGLAQSANYFGTTDAASNDQLFGNTSPYPTLPDAQSIKPPVNSTLETLTALSLKPRKPKPLEDVTITLENYATNLDEDIISWTINGKLVLTGRGEKKVTLVAGAAGEKTVVQVSFYSKLNSKTVTKELNFQPADVAVLWQADTYVPPFYKGRALPSYGSNIKLMTFPTVLSSAGKRISPKELVYTWKQNNSNLGDFSGYGKSVVRIKLTGQHDTFGVSVKDPDSDTSAERSTKLSTVLPQMIFFQSTPLGGIRYGLALKGDVPLINPEYRIVAEPFFFTNSDVFTRKAPLRWFVNNKEVKGVSTSRNELVVAKDPTVDTGRSTVRAEIENTSDTYLQTDGTVTFSYNKK